MTENKDNETAQHYALKALTEKVFKNKDGTLYLFHGIGAGDPSNYKYAFRNQVSGGIECFGLRSLEGLVEIKGVPEHVEVKSVSE